MGILSRLSTCANRLFTECAHWGYNRPGPSANEDIMSSSEFVIVIPHPDDEALVFGGIIYEALKRGQKVHLVAITNGEAWQPNCVLWKTGQAEIGEMGPAGSCSPEDLVEFGRARAQECVSANALLGLDAQAITFLGYPDLTLTRMFEQPDVVSPGRSAVQVSNTGKPFTGRNLTDDLKALLRKHPGATLLTTHVQDSHPDHEYAAKFIQRARKEVFDEDRLQFRTFWAVIHEPMAKKANADYWWPPPKCSWRPRHGRIRASRERRYAPDTFLPAPPGMKQPALTFLMADELWNEKARRPPLLREVIEQYHTQTGLLGKGGRKPMDGLEGLSDWSGYLLSFVKQNHLLWPAPNVEGAGQSPWQTPS